MYQTKDISVRTVLSKGGNDGGVGGKVTRGRPLERARFDIEDVDENANRGEDMGSLIREIGFSKGVLSGIPLRLAVQS